MNKNNHLYILDMRRKLLIAGVSLPALAWSGALRAQASTKVRRIGLLSPRSPSASDSWCQAFRLGLRDLGWEEGKNISIEYRYAEGEGGRLYDLAVDLVRLQVDVIVASSTSDAVAAQKATKAIPIVIAGVNDPVAGGLIASLARPGGNITGLSQMTGGELVGKRLELLREMVPKLSRVAVLWNAQGAATTLDWKEIKLAARKLGVQLLSLEVRNADEFDKAFDNAIRARAGALFMLGDPLINSNLKRIADLAAKSRLPSIIQHTAFAEAGGLVAYGPNRTEMFTRAATYVDKILKGAKPADLPVEQPTKFELVINMKTAKVLGITISPAVLVRATKVIE